MSFTLRSALLATVLLSAQAMATGLPSAQAAGTEFSFTSGNPAPEIFGNSYSQTLGGLTTTATAWSTKGRRNRYETAELEIYSGFGMGVCNRNEGVNCSSSGNMHALDNKDGVDLILFSFSNSVHLNSLTLLQFGGDSDLSLWVGTGSLNLAGLKPNSLGAETPALNSSAVNNIRTVDLSKFVGTYDWLAVSARLTQKDDFAKLTALNVQAVTTPVPEADNWAMLLAGLGLVGFAVSRRT
jgi:hypothetical protein